MTKAAPIVRSLDLAELDVVTALHALCFDEPWNRNALARLLTAPGGFGCLGLSADDGMPGGFALGRIVAKECELLSVGVIPASRQGGWGAGLVRGLLSEARRRGPNTVVLEVAEDNVAAIALYHAFGFAVVGQRRAYYQRADGPVDAHIMRLALGNCGGASQDVHDQPVD